MKTKPSIKTKDQPIRISVFDSPKHLAEKASHLNTVYPGPFYQLMPKRRWEYTIGFFGYQISLLQLIFIINSIRNLNSFRLENSDESEFYVVDQQSHSYLFVPTIYDEKNVFGVKPKNDINNEPRIIHLFDFDDFKFGSELCLIEIPNKSRVMEIVENKQPVLLDFDAFVENLKSQTNKLRQDLATKLEPVLNTKLQEFEQGTLDQKKWICDFVEQTIEPLGLAVECPKTGRPGKFKATTGNWEGSGNFYYEVRINNKREITSVSDILPSLKLMDGNPPQATKSSYRELVKRSRTGKRETP